MALDHNNALVVAVADDEQDVGERGQQRQRLQQEVDGYVDPAVRYDVEMDVEMESSQDPIGDALDSNP